MLPFLPSFPNQKQSPGGNESSLPQFLSSSGSLQNPLGLNTAPFLLPPMGNFPNPNALLGSLFTQQHLMQGLQNSITGALSHQQQYQCNPQFMPQFQAQQLNWLGGFQNSNFLNLQQSGLLGGPNLGQNLNQLVGLSSNGLLYSQNHPSMMGSSNLQPGFFSNNNPEAAQNKNNLKGLEGQPNSLKLTEPSLPSTYSRGRKRSQLQTVPSQAGGKNFSNNSSDNLVNRTFKPKFSGFGKREQANGSFKKFESFKSKNPWQKAREFPRSDRRGHHNRNDRNPNFSESSGNLTTMRKRALAVIYSESEIQRWREARKRNFPTRINIEKKLQQSVVNKVEMDSDAEVRRQQLKEVLAKQAELGVEVAEIPSSYLTKPEEEASGRGNNKRSRFRSNNRRGKKLKRTNLSSPAHEPVVQKREPTLLRKLLNADIRGDRSRLLQAFRFMVLNSFFKDMQNTPLVFPLISAKDAASQHEIVVQEKPTQQDEFDQAGSDVEVLSEPLGEDIVVGGEKSEEGEITE
ncbi:hypothetical protein HPP92_007280 [Vanilla planifolia]|uniref:FMR1-interacting protein 1 conserved domain-containing protein n=1 Tax=Vanilla planifolia TaxID=51239 RepID=A0A835V9G9_VANPL|nr:hypothetical protein HPP92_007280 [Vanilla planifolia]